MVLSTREKVSTDRGRRSEVNKYTFSKVDETMHRPKGKGYSCFILFIYFSKNFSVLISHLCVKFGERIVELTTCKVFKITIFIG